MTDYFTANRGAYPSCLRVRSREVQESELEAPELAAASLERYGNRRLELEWWVQTRTPAKPPALGKACFYVTIDLLAVKDIIVKIAPFQGGVSYAKHHHWINSRAFADWYDGVGRPRQLPAAPRRRVAVGFARNMSISRVPRKPLTPILVTSG